MASLVDMPVSNGLYVYFWRMGYCLNGHAYAV